MLNDNKIFEIANWFIKDKLTGIGDTELVINQSQVFNEGILFSYQSKKYTIDQEEIYEIIGDNRFIINRHDGGLFRNISPELSDDELVKLFEEKKLNLFINVPNKEV